MAYTLRFSILLASMSFCMITFISIHPTLSLSKPAHGRHLESTRSYDVLPPPITSSDVDDDLQMSPLRDDAPHPPSAEQPPTTTEWTDMSPLREDLPSPPPALTAAAAAKLPQQQQQQEHLRPLRPTQQQLQHQQRQDDDARPQPVQGPMEAPYVSTEDETCTVERDCSTHGAKSAHGNRRNGCRCVCKQGYAGAKCNECAARYYGYPKCSRCNAAGRCPAATCEANGLGRSAARCRAAGELDWDSPEDNTDDDDDKPTAFSSSSSSADQLSSTNNGDQCPSDFTCESINPNCRSICLGRLRCGSAKFCGPNRLPAGSFCVTSAWSKNFRVCLPESEPSSDFAATTSDSDAQPLLEEEPSSTTPAAATADTPNATTNDERRRNNDNNNNADNDPQAREDLLQQDRAAHRLASTPSASGLRSLLTAEKIATALCASVVNVAVVVGLIILARRACNNRKRKFKQQQASPCGRSIAQLEAALGLSPELDAYNSRVRKEDYRHCPQQVHREYIRETV